MRNDPLTVSSLIGVVAKHKTMTGGRSPGKNYCENWHEFSDTIEYSRIVRFECIPGIKDPRIRDIATRNILDEASVI